MRRAAFIYQDALSQHELRSDHPMRPVRLRYTYELLREYGAFDHPEAVLLDPRAATEEELGWLHTPEYVAAVKALGPAQAEWTRPSSALAGKETTRFTQTCSRRRL